MWLTMPKPGRIEDVDLGMTEEPEQVRVEQRIATARGIEERRAEVTVRQQHRDGARQHGQRQKQQEGRHQHATRRTAASCAASCPARAC